MHLLPAALEAQQPPDSTRRDTLRTRRDSLRTPRDTVPRRDSGGPARPRPGAVVPVPPRADSVAVDSTRRVGSAVPLPTRAAGDTIKEPLPRAEIPPLLDIGESYRWDRAALYASGALTLADLLDRVPGITGFRAGWIGAPMTAAYAGDMGRIRIFYDGLELDHLDLRNGRVTDLTHLQLWTLEEVAIERAPDEIRVHARSWQVQNVSPYTRTDVFTGDEDTNMYRGFFGKRYGGGEALQVAGHQWSTENNRSGGNADFLGILLRFGFAQQGWSADGFVNRTTRARQTLQRIGRSQTGAQGPALGPFEGTYTDAYFRIGYRSPTGAFWGQLLAGSFGFREKSDRNDDADDDVVPRDTTDTTVSRVQYVAAVGGTLAGVGVSATGRYRAFEGRRSFSPTVRLGIDRRLLGVSLFAERDYAATVQRTSATVRLSPLSFVSVVAGASHRMPIGDTLPFDSLASRVALEAGGFVRAGALRRAMPSSLSLRGEVGLRLARLWLSGGILSRDTTLLLPPQVFDPQFRYDTLEFRPLRVGRLTGTFAGIRGRIWKEIRADVVGTIWDGTGDTFIYHPRYQTRSQLFVRTDWLRRFPSGNFGVLASVTHEYRSNVRFPSSRGILTAPQSRVVTTLLEIRIQRAIMSWQFRNTTGEIYELVPGFEMPRAVNVYGVRWEFWN